MIRSFAPFVAASGNNMWFVKFSAIGSISWAFIFPCIGYFLGEIPYVEDHFYFVVMGIVLVSMIPAGIQLWSERGRNQKTS